jgi:hypothetical protein
MLEQENAQKAGKKPPKRKITTSKTCKLPASARATFTTTRTAASAVFSPQRIQAKQNKRERLVPLPRGIDIERGLTVDVLCFLSAGQSLAGGSSNWPVGRAW